MQTNLWTTFQKLIPQDVLQIGTVLAVDATSGTSTIELLGGGILTVRGSDVSVDNRVFVRAGVIEGLAPALPLIEQEI